MVQVRDHQVPPQIYLIQLRLQYICGHRHGNQHQASNFIMLMFTTHKNGLRGGGIRKKVSDNPLLCPKADLLWQLINLRSHISPLSTPLARVMIPTDMWENITPAMVTKTLKTTVGFCGPNLGFESKDGSARSLHADVYISLLCSGSDRNIINLIGFWLSENMIRYLHMQAEPLMRNFFRFMLTHGNYYFLQLQEKVPCF